MALTPSEKEELREAIRKGDGPKIDRLIDRWCSDLKVNPPPAAEKKKRGR